LVLLVAVVAVEEGPAILVAEQPYHQAEEGSLGSLEVACLGEKVAYRVACLVGSRESLVERVEDR
jgi:hypothetical protein